ncbi:unnamed protein product [Rotaria sordida]|uniref:Uncharacterized protein n=1 Tax=Rotaria sordida TaxID=392033 RepID=A0A819IM55_9BILA|nr:unnamed protein product [Rotaria sordida]
MNDIEEHIVEHVEELKKSIMEINLNLDNSDKIEHTYKIVSEINEIKRVEKIVKEIINKTLIGIKNMFCLEQLKEEAYRNLDFNKAEKAFYHLNASKETHEEVVLAMKNFNYGEVIVEMQAIQSSDIVGEVLFQQAKRALNLILNDFMEATRHKAITIGNDIPREKK